MSQAPLILASQSPRRRELLTSIGLPHEVVTPDTFDEPPTGTLEPERHARDAASGKAATVAREHPGRLVLGADTVVALGTAASDVLGKPRSPDDAARMLRLISGRTHRVLTAVALARVTGDGRLDVACHAADSEVTFRGLSDEFIARYVATGEPLDKAGAYGVQGLAATHVDRLVGSWSNVVGLPLELLAEAWREMGERLEDWQAW